MQLLGTSGRSQAASSSKMAKRRKTVEMREKVQSQGAFSARAHDRSAEIAGTNSALEVCNSLAFSKWRRLCLARSTEQCKATGQMITLNAVS